jgi:predicted amidohydrolase
MAKEQGCALVCFPECFSFIGAKPGEAQAAAEDLSGPTVAKYKALAKEHGLWLSLGGFQEKSPPEENESGKIYNTHLVIDAGGELVAVYRKIHLFDVPMTGLVESRQSLPGKELVACPSPAGRLGLTVCYDIRFPELYQKLTFLHGASVLLVPSAFAMKTGEAHWETLLRCRAIESQCYVFAAAQVGQHNENGNKRQSWGHSLAIDPWGKILADLGGTSPGFAVVEVDPALVRTTRENMPMHLHRRYDLYGDGPHAADESTKEEWEALEEKCKGLFFG